VPISATTPPGRTMPATASSLGDNFGKMDMLSSIAKGIFANDLKGVTVK